MLLFLRKIYPNFFGFVFGSLLLWGAQVGPEDAWLNWQKWLHWMGLTDINWARAANTALIVVGVLFLIFTAARTYLDIRLWQQGVAPKILPQARR